MIPARLASLAFLLVLGCVPKQPSSTTAASQAPSTTPAPSSSSGSESAPWGESSAASSGGSSASSTTAGGDAAIARPLTRDELVSNLPPASRRKLEDAAAMLGKGEAGRAQAALEKLEALAKEHPDAAIVFYDIGVAKLALDDTDGARKAWARATELDPALARAWLNLGVLSARAGRVDMALASFQSGTKYNPEDLELRVATVNALRALKKYDQAAAAAKEALAINSRELGIYTALAFVYLDTDRLDLARFILEKGKLEIRSAESDATLHAALGLVYLRQGYAGDALQSFLKATQLDPYQIEALQALGSYYLDNRAYADAAPYLERLVSRQPGAIGARLNLGIAYRGLGRYDEARRLYEECLRLDPGNPEPHRNLAILYGDYLKDYDTAVASVEAYRKAGGGPPADLDKWVASLKKDKARQEKAEQRKRDEEERKRREEAGTPAPDATPAPDPAPAPTGTDSPWGGGG